MKHFHTKSADFELCDFLVVRGKVKLRRLQKMHFCRRELFGKKKKTKSEVNRTLGCDDTQWVMGQERILSPCAKG